MRRMPPIVAFALVASVLHCAAADKAWYGFHIKPVTAGFPLNPLVCSVVIDKVKPNSPASEHDMRIGDEIIEAEGKRVPGARALQFVPLLSRHPGEWLHLRLKREGGEEYSAVVQ